MKTIFFTVALLLSFASFSQTTLSGNGGQSAQNAFVKIDYIAYQNSAYVIQITNLQSCTAIQKVSWSNHDTTFSVPGNGVIIVNLPGTFVAMTKIADKPLTRCVPGGGDMGNLEITSPVSLPITFKSIRATKISDTQVKIDFDVADVSGVNVYHVQVSTDGKTYKDVAIVFPDDTQPNRIYSVVVKLK